MPWAWDVPEKTAPLIEARAWAPLLPSGAPLWKPVSLSFFPGERILLSGPSGCGKSTFLLGLAGLLHSHRSWKETGELHRENRPQGYLFQNSADRFCTVEVADELAFGLENRRIPPGLIQTTIHEAARRFSLEGLMSRRVTRLSGGQQQRLALASLWAEDPEILFVDEAMSQLDAEGREVMLSTFDEWHMAHPEGLAVVVDHRPDLWGGRFGRNLRWENGALRECPEGAWGVAKGKAVRRNRRTEPEASRGDILVYCDKLVLAHPEGGPLSPLSKPIDFQLQRGRIAVITGSNGAGKSVFLKTLAGLAKPFSGSILHGELRIIGPPKSRRGWRALSEKVALCLQNPELQFGIGLVRDHDAHPPLPFGLDDAMDRSPYELSLGQQRRLSIGMLGSEVPLLLLDEPFYGQDRLSTAIIIDHLRTLTRKGCGMVVVCHDPDLSQELADDLWEFDGHTMKNKPREDFYPWWEGGTS